MYGMPGRQLARFALHGDRTLFLFILGGIYDVAEEDIGAQKAIICAEFEDGEWECGRVLSELDRAGTIYFDRVSQIKMDCWSQGRVALIGDAAFCVSLLAGQGSALAMISACVLAGELAKVHGEHALAFERYESLLRPFIAEKQRGAARFASSFAPRTRFGLAVRNAVLNSFRIPGLARLALGRDLNDRITLPDYAAYGTGARRCG
jgi:2-polyprenyl-6-methoxyphenol hydroxylase-like FAD-dependent oxidoreductase